MKKTAFSFLTISVLFITLSCGGSGGVYKTKNSQVNINALIVESASSSNIVTIRYGVTGPGMEPMTGMIPVTSSVVEFDLNILNGLNRYFLIDALDASGIVLYRGSATKDLDGMPVTLTIDIARLFVGKWGFMSLRHNNDNTWRNRGGTITYSPDGTGTRAYTQNDDGEINTVTETFTYIATTNSDGSIIITMTYDSDGRVRKRRFVVSDNGNIMLKDGIYIINDGEQKFDNQLINIFIKLDTSKTYINADFSGDYYHIGYDAFVGSDTNYMAWSGVLTADGSGSYFGNSTLNEDGTILTDTESGTYSVNSDGSVIWDSIAEGSSYLTGDGKLFILSNPGNADEGAFAMKKGDKTYSTADLAGEWAIVGFGDEYGTSFNAEFGSMTCDSSGNCTFSLKNQRDGNVTYESDSETLSVTSDGSFGSSLEAGAPSYAGAIGNNGNTIIFNLSFDQNKLYHREIFVGIRCSHCSNLADQVPPPVPVEITGTWEVHFRCTGIDFDVAVLEIELNETSGGDFSGSGTGTDIDGDQINMTLTGNFNNSTNLLSSTLTSTSEISTCVREDVFSTTLLSNDTGYIPMTQTQVCGCDAEVRLIKLAL